MPPKPPPLPLGITEWCEQRLASRLLPAQVLQSVPGDLEGTRPARTCRAGRLHGDTDSGLFSLSSRGGLLWDTAAEGTSPSPRWAGPFSLPAPTSAPNSVLSWCQNTSGQAEQLHSCLITHCACQTHSLLHQKLSKPWPGPGYITSAMKPCLLSAFRSFQPTEHSPQTTTRNLPSLCPRNGSKWVALCRGTAGPCEILSSITWPLSLIHI